LASVQLTRDADVQFYTGLSNTNVFKTLFDHLNLKASVMHYWKVPRQTLKQAPMRYIWKRHAKSCTKSPNLKRIMTNNNYNSNFSFLPGPGFKNKPLCFKMFYPHVRYTIDCTEVFIETPSSLDTRAQYCSIILNLKPPICHNLVDRF
jgi:hypothetical protein